jgi:hypothetical protein
MQKIHQIRGSRSQSLDLICVKKPNCLKKLILLGTAQARGRKRPNASWFCRFS